MILRPLRAAAQGQRSSDFIELSQSFAQFDKLGAVSEKIAEVRLTRVIAMTELVAVRADITTLAVDAIVNAANAELLVGGGVDGAIHRAGGPLVFESTAHYRDQGGCPPGDAVIGAAGNLPARYVIHTVGPIWGADHTDRHDATLASCYRTSLTLAAQHDLATIAFPGISTGVYGFPKDRATRIAVESTRTWLDTERHGITEVTFACFDDENLSLYEALLG